jgi:DNA-binding beta-propeller fold protein YncE
MWADDPARKKLYAVNQGCDVVTVFDANTQLPIRYIDVGNKPGVIESPHQVRVSPDGQHWYVNFINNNILQKFRCSDDQLVAEIPMVPTGSTYYGDWNTFLITKDSKKAYCVSWKSFGKLVCLDLVNNKFLKELNIPDNPHAIALSADEKKVYVGAQLGNYINEIDTAFTSINPISMDGQTPSGTSSLDIHDMVLDELHNRLVMTCQKTNEVRVYDIASNTVVATVSVATWPQEIVYTSKTDQFFITCMNDHSVARIDNGTWTSTVMPVGFLPHGICVDERKKLIYVLSRNVQPNGPTPHHTSVCAGRNGFVSFIDLNTFTLLKKKYEMSVDPYFIVPIP